jgi:hypothetical protein
LNELHGVVMSFQRTSGGVFYVEQPCRYGTHSQEMRLGPARSTFERLFSAVDFSVSVGLVDRSDKVDTICNLIKDK